MFDCLTKKWIINLKKFTADNVNYLGWELGTEITLTDQCELNFDKFSLHFNVKKKLYAKVTLILTADIDY